jgi:hypothetical protein
MRQVDHADGVRTDRRARGRTCPLRQQDPHPGADDGCHKRCGDEHEAARPPPAFRQLVRGGFREFSFASFERSNTGGLQSREGLLQAGRDELVEPLRLVEVLELMLVQVTERDIRQRIVAEQLPGRLGHERLSAMAGRTDARRAMDADADIALTQGGGLSRVDAHANAELSPGGPILLREATLSVYSSGDGVFRAPERYEERVALRVDLVAAVLCEARSEDTPVSRQRRNVLLSPVLQQPRGTFDVGKQKGDSTDWEFVA